MTTFDREQLTGLMVVDQNQLVGLVTVRDMLRFIDRQIPLDTPIGQVMTQDLTVLQGSELNHAFGAIHTMRQRGIHHLPVVDADHRPLDLITVKALQQHLVPPPMCSNCRRCVLW